MINGRVISFLICCYITNYPKSQWLETTTSFYSLSQFLWVRNLGVAELGSSRHWLGLQSIGRLAWGGRICFQSPTLPAAGGMPQFLSIWASPWGCLGVLRPSWLVSHRARDPGERERHTEAILLCPSLGSLAALFLPSPSDLEESSLCFCWRTHRTHIFSSHRTETPFALPIGPCLQQVHAVGFLREHSVPICTCHRTAAYSL